MVKPVAGSVRAGFGGDEYFPDGGFEVDVATGVISFAEPPAVGVEVTAGYEFDVPVWFDTDRLAGSMASF